MDKQRKIAPSVRTIVPHLNTAYNLVAWSTCAIYGWSKGLIIPVRNGRRPRAGVGPCSLLYSVAPLDPAVLAGLVQFLPAVPPRANYVPGRHATRISPLELLDDYRTVRLARPPRSGLL